VRIGTGPTVWKVPFLGGRLEFGIYPYGGLTRTLDPRLRGFRFRWWLTVFGGPSVNALLALATLLIVDKRFSIVQCCRGWDLLTAFVLANLLVLLWNLIPRRIHASHGPNPSDGLSLLQIPFLKEAEIRKEASMYYLVLASLDLNEKRYDAAQLLYKEGLRAFPESRLLKNDLGVAKLRSGDHAGAREEFLALSSDPEIDPNIRPLALSNIAAADLLLNHQDLLAEADRCSEEAIKSLAWHPSIKGTRASVLVALGKWDEGILLAREVMDSSPEPSKKATHACTIALGFNGKGNQPEALKHLEMAERLDPTCDLLPRVRSLLGMSAKAIGRTE
jgi:tetratricopeptide (TPR) repeat protein